MLQVAEVVVVLRFLEVMETSAEAEEAVEQG
jgi:hypothetical protein